MAPHKPSTWRCACTWIARPSPGPWGDWGGFPFFLGDVRPQGYLGRAIIRQIARACRLPEDSQDWEDDDTLKFLATLEESGTERRQVLVKFSPPMSQALGRRWADLLAMEFHALAVLTEAGLAEAGHRLIDAGGRRFLEVSRFDRTLRGGRIGVVSLEALHGAAVGGNPGAWTERVVELERVGLVDAAAVRDTRRLQAFGELIGNTDMHPGNLAFRLSDELPFTLAPAYDMLPMLWAPGPQGELTDPSFAPQPPVPAAAEAWREVSGLARDFWSRVISDQRVSREFAATARAVGETLARLAERFG